MRRIKSIIAAFLMASPFAAQALPISVINGDHNVVNGNSTGHLGLDGLGHTSTLFTDNASGWSSAIAAGNTILIEQRGTDGASAAAVNAFMSSGGRVIMLGGSGNSFFNSLFGSSTTFTFEGPNSDTFAKQAAAAGTTFADDAATLLGLSSHHEVTSGLPAGATVYYGAPDDETVFRMSVGSGDFFYLGFDYCCGGTAAQVNDWYGVLDSAINFDGATVPAPGTLALVGLGLAAFGFVRRKKA